MAEPTLNEISIAESDLIQGIQTAVKAFEARNPSQRVNALTYQFTAGGTIKYKTDITSVGSGALTPPVQS